MDLDHVGASAAAAAAPISGWGRAPPSRVDLQTITTPLMLVLQGNKSGYVECLRKYFARKLSKAELDRYVTTVLGTEHLYLHNLFISSILVNAQSPELPQSLSERVLAERARRQSAAQPAARKAARRSTDDTPQASMVQDAYLKSLASVQMNASARHRVPSRAFDARVASTSRVVSTRTFRRSAIGIDTPYESCSISRLLPDLERISAGDMVDEPLRDRMAALAAADGLDVGKRAPELLAKALEVHLKNVLSSTLQAVRLVRAKMTPAEKADAPVSLHEFWAAVRIAPLLFGEDAPVARERLILRDP
eukprot:Amastigsp_a12222_14.p1 type:complete len:307 gc:universal Amastigsp_a12222_14:39-959(+)